MKFFKFVIIFSLILVFFNNPAFSLLKKGDLLLPFSLVSVEDNSIITITMEDGRLTCIRESTIDGEKKIKKIYPAAVLVDFWATWCVPCRKAMPYMQKLHEKYQPKKDQEKGGLVLLGIAIDKKGAKVVKPFYSKLKITYPLLADPTKDPDGDNIIRTAQDMKSKYKVQTIPVVYLIDSKGIIEHVHLGFKKEHMTDIDKAVSTIISEFEKGGEK
jgi:thiol-disulfide isomerase/thioredoxin